MKVAIVGLGSAARRIHIPAYRRLRNVEVVAGCDTAAARGPLGFPVYESVERMLAEHRPDIVTIATPTASHFELASDLLARRIHVFCEKPFTSTVDEAAELLRIAESKRVQIVVNNEFRFMNCHRAAKAQIGTKRFGELLFVHIHQTFRTSEDTEAGWRGEDPERTCKEFGTHVFDLARYFFGVEPIRLRARMPRPGAGAGPDLLNLIDLEFPDERLARITLDRLSRGRHRYLDIRLDGTAAAIETELGGHAALTFGLHPPTRRPFVDLDVSFGGRARLFEGEKHTKISTDPIDLFAHATSALMAEFVAAIDNNTRPSCDGWDNIRTLALMRSAYESARGDRDLDLGFLQGLGLRAQQ